jgi:hypothetical protein
VTLVLTVGALTTDRSARAAQPGAPDSTGVVTGTVVDGEDAPLSRVNVRVQGTLDGDVTDDAGRYRFRTEKTGEPAVVEVSLLGFQTIRKEVLIAPGDTTRVDATLRPKVVQLDEAEVVSNAYTTGDVKGTATLSTLDVVTTPGAAGDIWRIGLMGYSCRAENVRTCVRAIGQALRAQGLDVDPDAAVASAEEERAHQQAATA